MNAATTSRSVILAIDDSEDDLLLFRSALRRLGTEVEVHAARGGLEALAMLAGLRREGRMPDLVLLDLNMPGMTGFEFMESLNDEPEVRDLQVIIFSSSRHENDVRKAYASGAAFYLMKPLGFEELTDVVRALGDYLQADEDGKDYIRALPCFCASSE